MKKFDKLFWLGLMIVSLFFFILVAIIGTYVNFKLNESPIHTEPIEIEQPKIIRDTVFIDKSKSKKIHKSTPVQHIVKPIKIEEQKQIIDTTKTQQL